MDSQAKRVRLERSIGSMVMGVYPVGGNGNTVVELIIALTAGKPAMESPGSR